MLRIKYNIAIFVQRELLMQNIVHDDLFARKGALRLKKKVSILPLRSRNGHGNTEAAETEAGMRIIDWWKGADTALVPILPRTPRPRRCEQQGASEGENEDEGRASETET